MKKSAYRLLTVLGICAVVIGFSSSSVSADTANLFANPSGETISKEQPASWNSDTWGGTHAIFSFPSVGAQDGARYLQTQVTKKGKGDAKWYPAYVGVTGGQTYTFSDWYRSDVPTGVDIEYKKSNGSFGYMHLADLPAAAQWTKYQATFTAPAGAKKLSVLHYVSSIGTLNVDAYALTAGTSTDTGGGTPTTTPAQTLVVTNSPNVASQQIGVNIPNQVLGGFQTQTIGEPIVVPRMRHPLGPPLPRRFHREALCS